MKKGCLAKATAVSSMLFLLLEPIYPQIDNSFGEVPITKIPEEMTFEEYQDLNRSLGLGIFVAALPLPGVVHLYTNEERASWLSKKSPSTSGISSSLPGSGTFVFR